MSTVQKVNFELKTNHLAIQVRDFALADRTLADPYAANVLVDGEWMTINSAYQAVRAADIAAAGNPATLFSWPLWAERGRTDVQAMGKAPLIWMGGWEADTRIFLVTSMALGNLVAVESVTIGSRVYAGLVDNGTWGTPGTGLTVGYITRMPVNNGGKLRIRGGMHF